MYIFTKVQLCMILMVTWLVAIDVEVSRNGW